MLIQRWPAFVFVVFAVFFLNIVVFCTLFLFEFF